MLRWLAKASLEQFLRVVDHTVRIARHQWPHRRGFWGAYIARGYVTDAWVVFGRDGQAYAERLARETQDKGMAEFGCLTGANADQSVLLLRIGDLVVADWSHNGTLRIWHRESERAPKFYDPRYEARALRGSCDFDTPHDAYLHWQQRARDYIRRETNIQMQLSEFIPPRQHR
jgi:hypothetical protein